MLFKPDLAEKVLSGEKTQTRRLQKPGDEAIRDETGRIVAVTRIGRRGRRLHYLVDNVYAVQPGRGKRAVGYVTLAAIRDQAVQDITESEAMDEGVVIPEHKRGTIRLRGGGAPVLRTSYRCEFALLWDAINGRKPAHRWDSNPKVWALTFEAHAEVTS